MYGRVAVFLVAVGPLSACGFDSKGASGGPVSTSGVSTGSSTGSPQDTDDGGSVGASGTSTGASSSGDPASSTTGSTTGAGASSITGGLGTGGGSECGNAPGLLLWVADATDVVSPMAVYESQVLPPCGDQDPILYAASPKKDEGTITWYFQANAPVNIRIFGLVFDDVPGIGSGADPDSYYLSVDDSTEYSWVYGCETHTWPQSQWGWVPARPLMGTACSDLDDPVPLNPGVHSIRLRNREAQAGDRIASVAALYLAPEPNPDPYTAYDPGG